MMVVFPIPPAPIRAIGVSRCAKLMISSINSSRPKETLGRGGRGSPSALDANQISNSLGVEVSDLFSI